MLTKIEQVNVHDTSHDPLPSCIVYTPHRHPMHYLLGYTTLLETPSQHNRTPVAWPFQESAHVYPLMTTRGYVPKYTDRGPLPRMSPVPAPEQRLRVGTEIQSSAASPRLAVPFPFLPPASSQKFQVLFLVRELGTWTMWR